MRQVVITPGEDGYWVAECPSLPGCVSQGHENNLDCFIRTPLAEGRVILDPHGFG